jgi:hypothetical protein
LFFVDGQLAGTDARALTVKVGTWTATGVDASAAVEELSSLSTFWASSA